MQVHKFISGLSLLFFLTACQSSDQKAVSVKADPETFKLDKYEAGQIWKFDAAPDDDSARITVLKVEQSAKGDTIIHVRLDKVLIYNSDLKDKSPRSVSHLPFSVQAMDSSVTTRSGTQQQLPEFISGYEKWREAYEKDQGGFWKISVRHVLDQMNKIMSDQKKKGG